MRGSWCRRREPRRSQPRNCARERRAGSKCYALTSRDSRRQLRSLIQLAKRESMITMHTTRQSSQAARRERETRPRLASGFAERLLWRRRRHRRRRRRSLFPQQRQAPLRARELPLQASFSLVQYYRQQDKTSFLKPVEATSKVLPARWCVLQLACARLAGESSASLPASARYVSAQRTV